jgi:RHS repeat-associated protein
MTYPNGNVLAFGYGASGGMDDNLSRITSLGWGSATIAHGYLGLGTIVRVDNQEPGVRWNLITGSGANPYAGFDQFGRVINNLWQLDNGTFAALDQFKYGFDLASNRLWRQNVVANSLGKNFDELYAYDGLYQLKDMQRGQLNGTQTAIVSGTLAFHETWNLDQTGNWSGFTQDATGAGTPTLAQSRDANRTNEITEIVNTTGPGWIVPQYDFAGNMTRVPQPLNASSGYDAKWDAWNRLVQLAVGETIIAQFAYDGLTRRVSAVDSTEARHFYYSAAWQILEERLGNSPNAAAPDRQFVWGLRYIDELILRDRTTAAGTLNERMYALQDANWNVTAICDISGTIQEHYAYSAYGVVQFLDADFNPIAASDYSWETLYCGYRYGGAIGLYLVRNRWLNSPLGFWLSEDPARYYSGSGMYVYGAASPATTIDPLGALCSSTSLGFAMQDPALTTGEPMKTVATIDAYLNVGPSCTGTKHDYRVNIDVDAYAQNATIVRLPDGRVVYGQPRAGCNVVTEQRLLGVTTNNPNLPFTLLVSPTPNCTLSFGLYQPTPVYGQGVPAGTMAGAGRGGCLVLYIDLDCAIPCKPNGCCSDANGFFAFGVKEEQGKNRTIGVGWWIAVGESSNCELETCHSGITIVQY